MTNAVSIAQSGSNNVTFRNRIINGAMVIDQRNAGAAVTPTTNTQYTVDRWAAALLQASKFSIQQNAGAITPPTGFVNYLGVTSLSAYSVLTGDTFGVHQRIEGLNCSDLAWGTASAATVTLSFRVYSSLTGTFGGALQNNASNRSYPFTYTVSVANTWTTVAITIPGDTTGTWLTTNGMGIYLVFGLGSGSTYSGTAGAWAGANYQTATGATTVVGTNGATFYITGVQLEAGTTASPFEYRQYGTELALCQRYYYQTLITNGNSEPSFYWYSGVSGQAYTAQYRFAVPMRGSPTITTSGTWLTQNITGPTFAGDANSYMAIGTSTTVGYSYFISNGSGMAKFSSEL